MKETSPEGFVHVQNDNNKFAFDPQAEAVNVSRCKFLF